MLKGFFDKLDRNQPWINKWSWLFMVTWETLFSIPQHILFWLLFSETFSWGAKHICNIGGISGIYVKGRGADGGGCKPIWVALYAEDVMLVALLDFPRNSTGGRKGGDPGITFCWIRPWTLLWVWARYPHVGDILLPETWLGRNIFRAIEKNMSWRNTARSIASASWYLRGCLSHLP